MQWCVVGAVAPPGLCSRVFPTQKPPGLEPPWPSSLTRPRSTSKNGVAAESPVDVLVYLRDVPGGDQGLLLHFLWENRGGRAGVKDSDPDQSPAAVLGWEPWIHRGSVSCRNLFHSPGRPGTAGVPILPVRPV